MSVLKNTRFLKVSVTDANPNWCKCTFFLCYFSLLEKVIQNPKGNVQKGDDKIKKFL